MEKIAVIDKSYEIYNLGSGNGFSVLEVVKSYEKAMK